MKRMFPIAVVFLLSFVFLAQSAQAAWWDYGWNYRKQLTLTSPSANNVAVFNVSFNATTMQADFDDIRFLDYSGTVQLDYWLKTKVDSSWALFYVKLYDSSNIYMYYGNPSASSTSNITSTFLVGDDANDGVLNTGLWTEDDKGTGCDVSEQNGKLNFTTTASQTCSANLKSNLANLTSNIEIVLFSAQSSATGSYRYFGVGNGSLVDEGGGSANWFITRAASSYWHDYRHAGSIHYLRKNDTNLATNGSVSFNSWTEWKMWIFSNGTIRLFANGTHQMTATDTQLLTYPKFFYLSQGHYSGHSEAYWSQVDYVYVRPFSGTEIAYSFGSEESGVTAPSITIFSPSNTTYYGITSHDASVNVMSSNSTSLQVNATLDGTLVYSNLSYANNTNITFTLSSLTGKSYNLTVIAKDLAATASSSVIFTNLHGVNISVYNANGTAIVNWNASSHNSTGSNLTSLKNNSVIIEWKDLLQGDVTMRANVSALFDSDERNITVNNTMGFHNLHFSLFRIQKFYAVSSAGGNVTSFILAFANTSSNYSSSTSNGILDASLRLLPIGTVNATVTASGYNILAESMPMNYSSEYNRTFTLTPAGINITAFKESSPSTSLNFSVTITNGTHTNTSSNVSSFYGGYTTLPNGEVTITVSSTGYVSRNYYVTINAYTYTNLKAYLLDTTEGTIVTFNVLGWSCAVNSPISNTLVTASIMVDSAYTAVGQIKSDASGLAQLYLRPSPQQYQIKAEHSSYVTQLTYITPSNPYIYNLCFSNTIAGNFTYLFDDISVSLTPSQLNYSLNQTNITFFISSSSGSLQNFGMNISYNSSVVSSQSSTTPSGGTLIYAVNSTLLGGSIVNATVWFLKSGYPLWSYSKIYTVWYVSPKSSALINVLPAVIGTGSSQLGALAAGLVSLIITTIAASFVARRTFVGAGIAAVVILGMFVYVGWYSLSAFGVDTWLYYMITVLTVISIAFIIRGI